ncbi:hypothetical protein [Gilliamella sp. ESL0250]|uniref:hypothetical protein n=1 Tax=Gilliamella sp. ESL0250 TaxID=2705036 RepID=UPI001580049E|nr:hypothetical protein [Gilliamella sp. ESL0250]NUF50403.1 hypothetical protein [Gilliamella sp. ESL0250]
MKYTKDEYIRLGRTLQTTIIDDLPNNALQFTTIAINFKNQKYRVLYKVIKLVDGVDFFDEHETIIDEIHEFNLYQQMIDYLGSIGIDIDQLRPAKGSKIIF